MRKIRRNIVIGILFLTGLVNAAYDNPEFVTSGNHLEEAKKAIKKRGEQTAYFQSKEERKDYDGDGIKDISMKTNKGTIYFVSSIDIKKEKSNEDHWIWYKAD